MSVKVAIGGREYTATVVDGLPAQDLALLKIEARDLAAVSLGNSDLLQIGDDVFAVGCPGAACGTVTAGRVANAGVTIAIEGGNQLQGMLMIDITTDHGSSGGPLVNSRGEVVGITTAGQQGSFGFSIPINQAIPLLRRVPGFRVEQMGMATSDLPFREIRDRMTPVTTYVETDRGTALQLPPLYDTSTWPRANGGVVCRTFLDPIGYCFLDNVVPQGYQLLGYGQGTADIQTWERGFSVTGGSLSGKFSQAVTASITQFASSQMAEGASSEIGRSDTSVKCGLGGESRVISASSRTYGSMAVSRNVIACSGLIGVSGAKLIYSMVARGHEVGILYQFRCVAELRQAPAGAGSPSG
jgi:hypothetical protein